MIIIIGLVDYDLLTKTTQTKLYIPNLEIMKAATYYRKEEGQFCRLVSLEEKTLDSYDKIFFFSEQDKINVPANFRRAKNVVFGGSCFTRNHLYTPFENEIIDYTIPRTFLYKDFLNDQYSKGIRTKDINAFLDNAYYRMYAGKNKLPYPVVQKRKKVFIFDRQFFYPDWKEILTELADRSPCGIYRIHPITCSTLTQFFELRNFPKFGRVNEIILDLNIPLSELRVLFSKFEERFLADINDSSNVFFPFGGSRDGKCAYFQDLEYTLNLLYSFWAKGILLKLKYNQTGLGIYNPIEELFLLAENWASLSTPAKKRTTLKSRMKKGSAEMEQYNEFITYLPHSKDLFEQTFDDLKQRRFWRV